MTPAPPSASASAQEREVFRDGVRKLLERHWPAEQALRQQGNPAARAQVWSRLSEVGLAAPGELALSLMAFQELGRAACPAPLLGAAIASMALSPHRGRNNNAEELLALLELGVAKFAVVLGAWDGDQQAGVVRLEDGILEGEAAFVEGAEDATHLVVVAGPDPALAIVAVGAQGMHLTATPGLADPPLARVRFDRTPAAVLPLSTGVASDLARVARLCMLARALGSAQRAFEMAVDYAKLRRQFGQVIGRFQAIQHKLADCLMSLEGTRLTMERAATRFDAGSDEWRVFAAAATAFGSPALRQVSLEAHHIFCAIGYAEEHEAPRHFRRVHADTARFGGVEKAEAELADYLLGAEGCDSLPDYDLGESANAFRQQVREWLGSNWSEAHRAENRKLSFAERGHDRDFLRRLGRQGWIGVSWPREFGGQDRSAFEQLAYVEELGAAGAPAPGMSYQGHALMKHGTPEQQARFLPGIQSGELTFCLGYSEPEAGSDLASLKTSAMRDGDEWVINGQKVWTTNADWVDYVWLAARTNPEAKPPHAGISMFIVPLNSKGITVRPSMAMYGRTFCTVFYDNVRVPLDALVGERDGGWSILTTALAQERMSLGGVVARIRTAFAHLVNHVRAIGVGDRPAVRGRLARLAAEIEVARELLMNSFAIAEHGGKPIHEAAMAKTFSGELMERLGEASLDILGMTATLSEGSEGSILHGELDQLLRHSIMYVVGGGTAQIQRNLIALRGLELPR